ncbi:MAG: ureidoglycolate dehydrogenase [Lactobacillales bacterium]|nr:ureidoglycolate dehydrogenase [Lactobacillales bacterium]
MAETVNVMPNKLHQLMKTKLKKAGMKEEQAEEVAKHLVYADANGVHSHGAVRVDYYAERIAKGGVTLEPNTRFEKTGPSSAVFHGDNGQGHYVANMALDGAIEMAKESGVAIVGVSRMSHSGMLSYYVEKAAKANMIAISMCQSDPMVVPFGGAETYYGTNPIAFGVPREGKTPLIFDMATTVQAWGKILDARSKNNPIPDTWAVDEKGVPTTDPHAVAGLLPIAGPKGYGLMMMVDILSGVLLGLPFGKHVSSMYNKMEEGRDLGQLFILIDPNRFTTLDTFKANIEQTIEELHSVRSAEGFDQVYVPGELGQMLYARYMQEGIPVEKGIYDYLESDTVHFNKYGGLNAFAEKIKE